MKYIILKATSKVIGVDTAFPFTFSDKIVHAEAYKRFRHLVIFDSPYDNVEVLSAGFVFVSGDFIRCRPGSETLNIPREFPDSANAIRDTRLFALNDSTSGLMTGIEMTIPLPGL